MLRPDEFADQLRTFINKLLIFFIEYNALVSMCILTDLLHFVLLVYLPENDVGTDFASQS